MRHLGALVGIVAIVAACGRTTPPVESTVPFGDPSVPWQAVPFRLIDPVANAAIAACKPPDLPAAVRVVLMDARGGDRVTILFESADRKAFGSCAALRGADGRWASSSSSAGFGSDAPPLPGPDAIEPPGIESEGGEPTNGLTAPGRATLTGRAGANVAGVRVVVAGRPIFATVGNGWFSVWWPSLDRVTQIAVIGADGQVLPQPVPILPQPPPPVPD